MLRLKLAENNSEDARSSEMQPFQSVPDDGATSSSALDHQDGSINDTAQDWDVGKAHDRRPINNDDIEELGSCGQQQTQFRAREKLGRVRRQWTGGQRRDIRNRRLLDKPRLGTCEE